MAIVRTAKGSGGAWDEFGTSTLTFSAIAIANGASVIVEIAAHADFGTITSVTWNGQALSADVDILNATNLRTAIYSKHGVTGATGDVVVTMQNNTAERGMTAAVDQVEGLLASAATDKVASATGSGTAPSSGATATTAQADEILIGVVGQDNGGFAVGGTWDGSFTGGGQDANTVGGIGDSAISTGYRIVAAAAAYTASKAGTTSAQYAAAIATYKAASSAQTSTPSAVNAAGEAGPATGLPGAVTVTPSTVDSAGAAGPATGVAGLRVVQPVAVDSVGAAGPAVSDVVADSYDPTAVTSMAEGVTTFIMRGSGTLGDQSDTTGVADVSPGSWPTGAGVLLASQNILGGTLPDWTITHVIFGARGVMTQDGSYLSNLRLDISGGSYPLVDPWEDIRPYTLGASSYIDRCRDSRSAPVTSRPAGGPWTWLDLIAIPSATVKMDRADIATVGHFAEIYVTEIYLEAYGPQGSKPVPIIIRSRAGAPIRKTLIQVASSIIVLSGAHWPSA